jgi:hypothetical protein
MHLQGKIKAGLGRGQGEMKGKTTVVCIVTVIAMVTLIAGTAVHASDQKESGRIHIMDQTGERWDITQAVALGFKPGGFEYGIGRYAFTTLDDSHLQSEAASVPRTLRVIGVTAPNEAQAYSVSKLSRHEIANTTAGSNPIVVGY